MYSATRPRKTFVSTVFPTLARDANKTQNAIVTTSEAIQTQGISVSEAAFSTANDMNPITIDTSAKYLTAVEYDTILPIYPLEERWLCTARCFVIAWAKASLNFRIAASPYNLKSISRVAEFEEI